MNKVFNINLGGYAFTIDENAYAHLSNYLSTIHQHFRNSEGYEEITGDIETRMAELFQERLDGRPIITQRDVEGAISIMGTPEDFGAEPIDDMDYDGPSGAGSSAEYRTGKRLFRDPDDEVVGGVCSGIAAYFGIDDPIWIRLAWVIMIISGGIGIPVYIVLWVLLPKAETASDRLWMRGDPINVSNISKIIEEEFDSLSETMSDLGAEFASKKKDQEPLEPMGEVPLRRGYHC